MTELSELEERLETAKVAYREDRSEENMKVKDDAARALSDYRNQSGAVFTITSLEGGE